MSEIYLDREDLVLDVLGKLSTGIEANRVRNALSLSDGEGIQDVEAFGPFCYHLEQNLDCDREKTMAYLERLAERINTDGSLARRLVSYEVPWSILAAVVRDGDC